MIKKMKPTSPGRRGQTIVVTESKKQKVSKRILKKLTISRKGDAGRSHGRISVQHRRKGADRRIRIVDFKRDKFDIPATVESIEYDPMRTADIALLLYSDGERRFILAPEGLKAKDVVKSGEKVELLPGNSMPIGNIPVGTPVHNVEIYPGGGGKMIRSAGTFASVTAKEGKYVNLKMPSGEIRRVLAKCYATIGQLSRVDWKLMKLGKAGRAFHMGTRPTTRGKARSDGHPLGGSYSRRLGRQPVDKWGNISKGGKTRSRKSTDKYIVKSRRIK